MCRAQLVSAAFTVTVPRGIPLRNGKLKVSDSTSAPALANVASAPLIFRLVPELPPIVAPREIEVDEPDLGPAGLREQLRLVLADLRS